MFINNVNPSKINRLHSVSCFLLKKTMSQNRKTLNTGVSRALRIQNKGVQPVEAHDESPARLSLFIPLV